MIEKLKINIEERFIHVEGENLKVKYMIVGDSLVRRTMQIDNSNFFREYTKTTVGYWTKRGRTKEEHKTLIKQIDEYVVNAVHEIDKNIFYIR